MELGESINRQRAAFRTRAREATAAPEPEVPGVDGLTRTQRMDAARADALRSGAEHEAAAHEALLSGDTTRLIQATNAALHAKARATANVPTYADGGSRL
ncbi:hypothetical protein GCM10027414_00790 [Humibacter ginsengiterrae]